MVTFVEFNDELYDDDDWKEPPPDFMTDDDDEPTPTQWQLLVIEIAARAAIG